MVYTLFLFTAAGIFYGTNNLCLHCHNIQKIYLKVVSAEDNYVLKQAKPKFDKLGIAGVKFKKASANIKAFKKTATGANLVGLRPWPP